MYVAYNLRPNWLPSSKVPQGLLVREDFLRPYNQQIDIFVVAGSVVCITCFIPQVYLSKAVEYVFFFLVHVLLIGLIIFERFLYSFNEQSPIHHYIKS